jgi:hypothetical protein
MTPGTVSYGVSYAGGAAPTTTWHGQARVTCYITLSLEFSTTSTAPGTDAWWSLSGSPPARLVGAHPIIGELARPVDTVSVWWGHLVSNSPRTHGTLTVTFADSVRVDGRFIYTGPAGVGQDTVDATVQGEFSALYPYRTPPGC